MTSRQTLTLSAGAVVLALFLLSVAAGAGRARNGEPFIPYKNWKRGRTAASERPAGVPGRAGNGQVAASEGGPGVVAPEAARGPAMPFAARNPRAGGPAAPFTSKASDIRKAERARAGGGRAGTEEVKNQ